MSNTDGFQYVGLDPSLTSPGFCLATTNNNYLASSTYSSKQKGVYRLDEIVQHFEKNYLSSGALRWLLIEGYAFSKQGKGQGMLERAELFGIIKHRLFKGGYWNKVLIITPGSIKKFATGIGNVEKIQMMMQAYKEFGLEFKKDDEADAFWLAQIGKAIDGNFGKLNKKRQEVVELVCADYGIKVSL